MPARRGRQRTKDASGGAERAQESTSRFVQGSEIVAITTGSWRIPIPGILIGTTDWRGLCQRARSQRTGVAVQPLKAAQPQENAERS